MKIRLTIAELGNALKVYLEGEDVGLKIGVTADNPSGNTLLIDTATFDFDENWLSFEVVDTTKM